jgi:hypothetical protein
VRHAEQQLSVSLIHPGERLHKRLKFVALLATGANQSERRAITRESSAGSASGTKESQLDEEQRLQKTSATEFPFSISLPFHLMHRFGATEVEILGIPDFLIFEGDGICLCVPDRTATLYPGTAQFIANASDSEKRRAASPPTGTTSVPN